MKNTNIKCADNLKMYPTTMNDTDRNSSYMRGEFLGMGSFGKCFVAKEVNTGKLYAAKIMEKSILKHPIYSFFLLEELSIHRLLKHKNIVSFYQAFDSKDYIFIILQLCTNGTLMELKKRRESVTLIEAKYYMNHILNGVYYLHKKHIVHGDLKLSNIFLTNRMTVKIGDFGLATSIPSQGDKIRIQCGTPNYMAPEIIQNKGHSYAGDVWAIGCILYALLVGKLPFQSYENHVTYKKIKNCEYSVYEPGLRKQASAFIRKLLQKDPDKRPTVLDLKNDDFMQGFIPQVLPNYTLWESPKSRDLIRKKISKFKLPSSSKKGRSNKFSDRQKRIKSSKSHLRQKYTTGKQLLAVL